MYFERFDEAEALYKDIDRKDLAIDVRVRQGDWSKVRVCKPCKCSVCGGGPVVWSCE